MLSVAAEDEEFVPEKAVSGLQGWVDCFDKAELKETIFCGGVTNIGDIAGNAALEKARQAGKNI